MTLYPPRLLDYTESMKNSLFTGILILILCIFSLPVEAVETGTVIGEGAKKCRKLAKASRTKENKFIICVQGYFSAYNAIAPDINNVSEGKTFFWVLKELKEFCKANPDVYVNDAVVDLVKRLHPKGITIGDPKHIKLKFSEN